MVQSAVVVIHGCFLVNRYQIMEAITAIETQKRNKKRVSIFLEGEYAFSLAADAALPLKIGQRLSRADVDHLVMQDNIGRAKEITLHFLSYRPRSEAEVIKHLSSKGFTEDEIAAVVTVLAEGNLLDDQAFAHYWVEQREEFKPRGLFALRQELRQKGISQEIIENAVADVDELDSAMKAGRKKADTLTGSEYTDYMRKLCQYLERRGFTYGVSADVARELWRESSSEKQEEQISRGD